jgi:hypothetical protein
MDRRTNVTTDKDRSVRGMQGGMANPIISFRPKRWLCCASLGSSSLQDASRAAQLSWSRAVALFREEVW